jgi:hypothetical protein
MIIVTGTKRSGTSMWMQVLEAAGIETIGDRFPRKWEASIGEANPRGFYESRLRNGIYYRTNPDPKTGAFLRPKATRKTAVKVFIPGLVRSDMAYLHRVIGSVRDWRAYSHSLRRLYALEDAWFTEKGEHPTTGEPLVDRARRGRPQVPPAVEWWFENYDLVRDVVTRRYSFHIVSYARMLRDPAAVLEQVVPWLGVGALDAALEAVEPRLSSQATEVVDPPETAELPEGAVRVFDDFFESIDQRGKLPVSLIDDMNGLQRRMEERWAKLSPEREVR